MSNLQSALGGASFTGLVEVQEAPMRGMITLRGDLAASKVKKAATAASGTKMPSLGMVTCDEERAICWMSPDELLVTMPYTEVLDCVAQMEKTLGTAHSLVANVSDARAIFTLRGDEGALRDVLAKLTPADMSAEGCPVRAMRRTRLAQVPAAFWFQTQTEVQLICFRSVAEYVFKLLCQAADSDAKVDFFS